ncbi:hypothetical protein D3C74_49250 [compost metagenome]
MYSLDADWLKENFEIGTLENTKPGMRVHVRDVEYWDEVLRPIIVKSLSSNGLIGVEDNPTWSIPPIQRGEQTHKNWFISKNYK